ncbi:MAG: glycosyltransferase [Candidatus Omnitrophica bacterium]|nr:glycosyltransferase [Candidatus Omnitrophota bacterium]
MDSPKIAVIILNWNRLEDIIECLGSVLEIDYPKYEVIVVDNASTDGSADEIAGKFPGVTLVRNGRNLGYAEGNNVGIRYALGNGYEYIVLLNNDTVVEPCFLERMLSEFTNNANLGLLSPRIYNFYRPEALESAGLSIDIDTGDSRFSGAKDRYNSLSGAALMIKSRYLEKVGFLDGRFFLYYEDADLCMRFAEKGYEIKVAEEVSVRHKHGEMKPNTHSLTSLYYSTRNKRLFCEKRKTRDLGWLIKDYLAGNAKGYFHYCRYKERDQALAILSGMIDGMRGKYGKARYSGGVKAFARVITTLFVNIFRSLRSLKQKLSRIFPRYDPACPAGGIDTLFVSHTSYLGGSERALLSVMGEMNKRNARIQAVLPSEGPLKDQCEKKGIRVVIVPLKRWIMFPYEHCFKNTVIFWVGLPARVACLMGVIRKDKAAVVLTNTVTTIDGAIAAKLSGVPHVWHIHEMLSGNSPLVWRLPVKVIWKIVEKLSDAIIVPSETVKDHISGFIGKNDKIKVIYNGVETREDGEKELYDVPKVRGWGMRPFEERRVAAIGSINESKGYFDFVEAATLVSSRVNDVTYYVAGTGSDATVEKLKLRLERSNMLGKFRFLGQIENSRRLLADVDLVVCPSWEESFSRVSVEAMMEGKPVVATKCGGPEEIIVDGETGYLVAKKSPADIAKAMVKVLSDPERAKQMGLAGRKRAVELFNMEKCVSSTESLLKSVCNKKSVSV